MDDYWRDFVQESEEQITELNNSLLTLEQSPDDEEAVDEIFRTAHTLKGNCGAMGLARASDLAHAMEDLLDAVRAGEVEVTADRMDTIFDAVDELEAMIEEVALVGEIERDPSETIESLRAPLEDAARTVTTPTTDEIDATLARFDPRPDDGRDVYLVRLAIDESDEVNNGLVVVEALIDAFDLVGTDPSRTSIENEAYAGTFDAVFASAVGEGAIAAALEPVDAVADFDIVAVTDRFESVTASSDFDSDPLEDSLGAGLSSNEARDMSVDDLLDEFEALDDLDALVEEIDDASEFDDLGDAGSFADFVDDDPAASDEADVESSDAESADTADGTASDDEVDDAGAVFEELKEEVEMVGFDELQAELDELEFDEFDAEDEVGMDELLGDDVDTEDSSFLDVDGSAGGEIEDHASESPGADVEDDANDDGFSDADAIQADDLEDETIDGLLGEDSEPEPTDGAIDAVGESDVPEPSESSVPETDEVTDWSEDDADAPDGTESSDGADEGGEDGSVETDALDDTTEFDPTSDSFAVEESDVDFEEGPEVVDDLDVDLDVDVAEFADVDVAEFADVDEVEFADVDVDVDSDFDVDDSASFDVDDSASFDVDDGDDPSDADLLDMLPEMAIPDVELPEPDDRSTDDGDADHAQSVRVDKEQIDTLLTLVEGLVTSRVRLRHAIESGEDLGTIGRELDDLEEITSELQEAVMGVRLVPLRTVTNRLPRMVRDLAREQDKQVSFEQTGEGVELDRDILDRIGDPLVHLVRNAVDHGIESPDAREDADKPREGTVELRAERARDRVTIEISDDGSGLDPDRLRSAAVDAEVVSEAEADDLSDEEVYDLVFHPGLTTADEVTDVSGRGVGMDVVKRTVDELNGSVSIDSELGEGTTVTMVLPVSVAIADVLFVESGGEEFGVPIEVVNDVSDVGVLETVDGEPVLDDEGSVTVVELDEALDTSGAGTNGDGMMVRIRDEVRPIALHCDGVRGRQEVVVKPFEGFMSEIPGMGGATVRGRGEVVNILDVTTL